MDSVLLLLSKVYNTVNIFCDHGDDYDEHGRYTEYKNVCISVVFVLLLKTFSFGERGKRETLFGQTKHDMQFSGKL